MPDTSTALLERLSDNSARYRDPLAHVDWQELAADREWLPQNALSLYGLPQFDALSPAVRRVLSQLEFINFMQCGLWLERVFLQRLTRRLRPDLPRAEYEYLLHELREETGHSLMFLRAIEAGACPLPCGAWRAPAFADFIARRAPTTGVLFWLAVVIAEDVPDRFNRSLRQYGERLNPAVRQICTLHVVDEARHPRAWTSCSPMPARCNAGCSGWRPRCCCGSSRMSSTLLRQLSTSLPALPRGQPGAGSRCTARHGAVSSPSTSRPPCACSTATA